ncbi:MAG: universal stress protein [Deltaproteobacteria bacterium]|nr:universal stress protein [Deltaproteobacteria bacterium]MBW2071049.1 universal stress protein [Deltaproteobacteria bacterium]
MREVNKILVAICFSEYCDDTFRFAVGLAEQLQADLLVANVVNIRDVQAVSTIESMGYSVSSEDYIKGVIEERQAELEKMVAASGFPRDKVRSIFRVGHPVGELLKTIKNEGVDLVVMGTKGRSNHPHIFVGSVAEKMFRKSPVTVVSHRRS